LPPAGASKPDWQIVAEIARSMGHSGFGFKHPEEVWDEVRSLCSGARGMTYARLDHGGLQWPCPTDDHPGTAVLHTRQFGRGTRATLQCIDDRPTTERTSSEYPLLLMTGRSLYQFNAGTMTGRTRNAELRPSDLLDISADDAAEVGVRTDEPVRVVSRYGVAVLPVRVSGAVARGQLFATFQNPEPLVNAVTGANRDRLTDTPEYKVTAVRLERVPSRVTGEGVCQTNDIG
jgi:formate dehydrogenase major subunit